MAEGVEPEETDSLASIVWDINNSSKESLMVKLGIGERKAAEIVAYRESQGGIKDLEELKNIRGISDKSLQKIKENLLG